MRKIDLHVHFLPEAYREALNDCKENPPDGFPVPNWNVSEHHDFNRTAEISTSILSVSSPHINFGDQEKAARLSRKANEQGAVLMSAYPGKFGLFACLPLPGVKESLDEIAYAADTLGVNGFALPTNTCGVYLGHLELNPIFASLNRRGAVVVIHPNKPSSVPEDVNKNLPAPIVEFFFDTTRTFINMLMAGIFKRYPDIKFIIPHAGALLPIVADRLSPILSFLPSLAEKNHQDIYTAMSQVYYDVAGFCLPRQLKNLLELVDTSHLVYGSDYPYTPQRLCGELMTALEQTPILTEQERLGMFYENAQRLLGLPAVKERLKENGDF